MAGLVGKSSTKPSSTWEINLGEIGFQTNKIWGFPHNLHNQPPRPPTWWPLTVARACAAPLGMAGSAQLWKFRNGNGLNMWVLHGFSSNKWGFRFISPAINGDSYETMGIEIGNECPCGDLSNMGTLVRVENIMFQPAKARKKIGIWYRHLPICGFVGLFHLQTLTTFTNLLSLRCRPLSLIEVIWRRALVEQLRVGWWCLQQCCRIWVACPEETSKSKGAGSKDRSDGTWCRFGLRGFPQ